jgi:hypothetical protein
LAGKWKPSSPVAFRRAARYLKPIPEATQSYSPMVPALWDLFGMLTDKQIAALGNAQQLARKLR